MHKTHSFLRLTRLVNQIPITVLTFLGSVGPFQAQSSADEQIPDYATPCNFRQDNPALPGRRNFKVLNNKESTKLNAT